ncbi:MAG: OsmC family protein [Acidobacteria bacterium]|nr:OsmC family protein [Acidobacteriota bacterium]
MHTYGARVQWSRRGAAFTDHRYSRGHEWSFDGGLRVAASASPGSVPLPYAVVEAIDPEEALVASASSCHMLWFLSIAAKRGLVVDTYVDDATGMMEKNGDGKLAITRITLRPRVEFAGGRRPSGDELRALHEEAHGECFIANSLRSTIVIEPPVR